MKRSTFLGALLGGSTAAFGRGRDGGRDARIKNGFRKPDQNGWIFVHLEGTPEEIGFQHGYLLSKEIQGAYRVVQYGLLHDSGKEWSFFRRAAREVFWERVPQEYQQEITGIAEGMKARGATFDVWDGVILNAWLEFSPYYIEWFNKQNGQMTPKTVTTGDHCSAFVATGSYTKDGKPVVGHNAWTGYMEGSWWNIIFDVAPKSGHRFVMDGFPGLIHSGDDFGVNGAGMVITETTISQFSGFDPKGIPEYARARKALQYAGSIDEFAAIMKEGNNGGYANNWLVADTRGNEIASLELGLKNEVLKRSKDGYFVGSNFPADEKVIREETSFPAHDPTVSPNARRARWEQLMAENKGKIDAAAGQRFLGDHWDSYAKKVEANERTLCGHNEFSPRGMKPWLQEFGAGGAVQNKVADAAMASRLTMRAAFGHACGMSFKADEFLKKHPEFGWQKGYLRDIKAHGWTTFRADGV